MCRSMKHMKQSKEPSLLVKIVRCSVSENNCRHPFWPRFISGQQEFFILPIWWAGYFFPFFPISFLLHLCCMQFFPSDKRLQEFFFKITPRPPQELNSRPLRAPSLKRALVLNFSFCALLVPFKRLSQ